MFVEQTDQTYRNLTALKPGIYRDCLFIQCDFSCQTFANYEFVDCEFKECNLSNLKTDNASFKTVLFSGCKLIGFDFSGINSFLLKLNFEDCNLNLSSFYELNLSKTLFTRCEIQEVDFTECNLTEAVFEDSSLSLSIFNRTNLSHSDLTSARDFEIDPRKNNIKKARFTRENIAGLVLGFGIIIS